MEAAASSLLLRAVSGEGCNGGVCIENEFPTAIVIDARGAIAWEGERLDEKALNERIRKFDPSFDSFMVSADPKAPYGIFAAIVSDLQRHGASRVVCNDL